MGGYVTALIRFSDGSLLGKESWTNRIIPAMRTYEFLMEDKDFIYNSFHKDDYDSRCPSEYGLIFFDFLKKKVFSVQSYSNPGVFYIISTSIRHEESGINKLLENNMISKAVYKRDGIKTECDVSGITNINDFFIRRNKSLEMLLKDNNIEPHSLSLDNLDSIYQDMINYSMINLRPEDIVEWYKNVNNSFTINDYNNPENFDAIKKIKKDYLMAWMKALKESGKDRLLDFWYFYINRFEYNSHPDSQEAFIDLKRHIENEGIIFTDEENKKWKEHMEIYTKD